MDAFADVVVELGELLCVKLPPPTRDELLDLRQALKDGHGLTYAQKLRVRRLVGHYRLQIAELRAARERARMTNGRRAMGLSLAEVAARIAARAAAERDLGF
jgi:hypothetical protein